MPSMRTNLLRVELAGQYTAYEVELACRSPIDPHHHHEISSFLHAALPHALYAPPALFAPAPLTLSELHLFLSNGAGVQLRLVRTAEGERGEVLGHVARRLMRLTELLYCGELESCFNPFEQRKRGEVREMPGFSLRAAGEGVLAVVPVLLVSDGREELGDQAEVLLDYHSGNFCLRQNIVRLDKSRGEVHFRDGSVLLRSGLRAVTVRTLGGFPLANELQHFLARLKDCSVSFRESWGLKFDSRFLETPYQSVHPGVVAFRGGHERSLAEIITPMSQYNWAHNWIEFMRGGSLEDVLEAELVLLCGENERRWVLELAQQLDAIRFRMGLSLACRTIPHGGLQQSDELIYLLRKESAVLAPNRLYVLAVPKARGKAEREGLEKVVQFLIEQRVLFHLAEVETQTEESFEAVAYQQLCLFYAKFRLNPWKIKSIPFSNAPMAVASLHVQRTRQGLLSVALVFTMNLFLTKFTAAHRLVRADGLRVAVEQAIRECIAKFQSAHGRAPTRIFVFRGGVGEGEAGLMEEQLAVREGVLAQTGSQLTYVCLTKDHLLRTFTQFDSNYVSKDTCKRVQALLYAEVRDELYLQLQLEEPMHRIRIYQVEKNDPNFVIKVLELTAKVVFAGVGNGFGRGLGFIDYARKLNQLREYNLEPWKALLRDGVLPFL